MKVLKLVCAAYWTLLCAAYAVGYYEPDSFTVGFAFIMVAVLFVLLAVINGKEDANERN